MSAVSRNLIGCFSDIELQYQKQVEKAFFHPSDIRPSFRTAERRERTLHWRRTHAPKVERIEQAFREARTIGDTIISCRDTCARNIVLAESRISQRFVPRGYYCNTGYVSDPKRRAYTREERVEFDMPPQTFSYCQQVEPHRNHKGNYHTQALSDYDKIGSRLLALTSKNLETQKRLAALMLTFPKAISGITPDSLQQALGVTPSETDVKFVNSLCYNTFIKEVARRQLPEDETHHEPWAIALIRALKLAAEGHISLEGIFQQNALYGPFTEIEIGKKMTRGNSNVERNIRQINQEYWEKISSIVDARKELGDIYGGASDSDDEVYPQLFQTAPAGSSEANQSLLPDPSSGPGAAHPSQATIPGTIQESGTGKEAPRI